VGVIGSGAGRWLAAGGAAVLAAVIGVALVMQSTGDAACAAPVPARGAGAAVAPPVGDAVHRGKATFYTLGSGGGNCSYVGPPADGLFVALGPGEYAAAAACGGYLDVTGPKGTVRVKIVDQCPECAAGHIDLSRAAFAKIADPVQGVVPVTYRAVVNPRLPGPLSFRIKEGASQWWFAVLVIDHGNPLRTVEARTAGGSWQRLTRTDYNYWLRESGLGSGPYAIRLTDVYGQRATATGIQLQPERTQRTRVTMYGGSAPTRSSGPRPTRAARTVPPSAAATTPAPVASIGPPTTGPAVTPNAKVDC
jgi:expansin (peptidoglycan-binding protein)